MKLTEQDLSQLREDAHTAPLNKVGMDHKGRRFLATHSMAWATASQRLMAAERRAALEASR